jgi:beta-N-acetylhexosaminidase
MVGIAERLPPMPEATAQRLERALAGTGNPSPADRAQLIAKRDALLDLARDLA